MRYTSNWRIHSRSPVKDASDYRLFAANIKSHFCALYFRRLSSLIFVSQPEGLTVASYSGLNVSRAVQNNRAFGVDTACTHKRLPCSGLRMSRTRSARFEHVGCHPDAS